MTHDTEALRGLFAEVEAATEGGQELDEAIHATLLPDDPWWQAIVEGRRLVAAGQEDVKIDACNCNLRADSWALGSRVASYTTSVDAALRLVARVLPGWTGRVSFGPPSTARLWHRQYSDKTPTSHDAPTPALAILGSLLSAALARGGHHEA